MLSQYPKLKKNDVVQIVSGANKGKTGKVLRLIKDKNRIVVEKINIVKRHQKARAAGQTSEIIEKEAPLHVSNVLLYCDKCGKGVRFKTKRDKKGAARVCAKCESNLEKS